MNAGLLQVSLPAQAQREYCIHLRSGLLQDLSWMPQVKGQVVIVTDTVVKQYYGEALLQRLKTAGYQAMMLDFPAGESSKNANTHILLQEKMLALQCNRESLILALGGGVVGDMAGFVASTLMRGIPYIQIPTTLLAMVDSSVGGKTGINTPQGKNLIGSFWHPEAVIADLDVLKTLPAEHCLAGLIEALKIFITLDSELFRRTVSQLGDILDLKEAALEALIRAAVTLKSQVVQADEQEKNGLRLILNFGHTLGHALENLTDYAMLHGHAVAYGILVEAKIACLLGMLAKSEFQKIQAVLARLGFEAQVLEQYSIDALIRLTQNDKKIQGGEVRYVLLKTMGQVHTLNGQYAHPVPEAIVRAAFSQLLRGE